MHAWYDDSLARAVTGEDLKLQQRAARAAPRKETSPAGSTWAVSISQGFGIQARGIGITMPIVLAGITMPIVLRVGIPKP